MTRSLPALCVLLLVVGSVVAAAPASGTTNATAAAVADPPGPTRVTQVPNSVSYLALDGPVERSERGTAGLDVGGALAADAADLHSRYDDLRLDARYRAAPNASARRAAVQATASRLGSRIDALDRRDRRVRAEYNADRITTAQYLRQLAIVDTEARRLGTRLSHLNARVDAAEGQPVSDRRLASLKADLLPLTGPVRGRAADAMAGRHEPVRAYVATSADGVVLATVDSAGGVGGEYVRETYVASARNQSRPNQFANGTQPPLDAAEARARELYPWAFENHQGYAIGLLAGGPSLRLAAVYPVSINHPHGVDRTSDVVAYLDGGTADVFREVQYLGVERVPTTRLGERRTDGLVLRVNATYPGGPARVAVSDAGGSPVAATVLVDGEPAGRTGLDGERWIVLPRGQANVTVTRAGARATVVGRA
ncbi:MAG: hypothetical protein ABEJ23_09385 [Haloarculaceae archaeon]